MRSEDGHRSQGLPVNKKPGQKNDHEDDILLPPEDILLLDRINDYFKGYFDTEDVKNDPAFTSTDNLARSFVSQFKKDRSGESEVRTYIRDSIAPDNKDAVINQEIRNIKQESDHKQVDNITAEWVRDWHERKRNEPGFISKEQEVRDFVTGSIQKTDEISEINETPDIRRGNKSIIRVIPWITVAAAAVFAAVLLVKVLTPSADPEKIFSKYYEPYYAASVVTRSTDPGTDETLRSALESYRNHNYQMAAVGFSKALLTVPFPDMPKFYLGVTFIELNDYERAIMILESLADRPGDFMKDAQWYLGLLYIKSGNRDKAHKYFESLVRDTGFYSERSEKILRVLK